MVTLWWLGLDARRRLRGCVIALADHRFEHLSVAFQPIHSRLEPLDGEGHVGEQIGGVGLPQHVRLHLRLPHGAAAGEHPVDVEPERLGQPRDEVDARCMPAEVSTHGLGMGVCYLTNAAERPIADGGLQPIVQSLVPVGLDAPLVIHARIVARSSDVGKPEPLAHRSQHATPEHGVFGVPQFGGSLDPGLRVAACEFEQFSVAHQIRHAQGQGT